MRAQLDTLTTTRGWTMAGQVRCPGCGGRKLLHVTKVLDRAQGSSKTLAIAQKGAFRERSIGEFQVYICRGCWPSGTSPICRDGSAPDPGDPYR